MASQLSIYNGALLAVGQTALASITDDVEARYLLDAVWDNTNGLIDCLQEGQWTFATRYTQVNADPAIVPTFGLRFGFSHPADFVRTVKMCSDPYFNTPLTLYQDQSNYWLADIQVIFVAYVSKDSNQYGLNLSLWPPTFTRWVEHYFAWRALAPKFVSAAKMDGFEKKVRKLLVNARSKDAMELPTSFPALGSWVRSRWGRNTGWDRGNPNRLIG